MGNTPITEVLALHMQDETTKLARFWSAGQISGKDFGNLLEMIAATHEHIDEGEKLNVTQTLLPFKYAVSLALDKGKTLNRSPLSDGAWNAIRRGLKSL